MEDYDANWVVLRIEATNGSQVWQAESACLLTWDLALMQHWLQTITQRKRPAQRRFFGMESDFLLLYRGHRQGKHRFYVRLSERLAPGWTSGQLEVTPVTFLVESTEPELLTCCDEIGRALESFPRRGKLGQRWTEILRKQGQLSV